MLRTKPTANLTGVTIQGDYNDFSTLVDSIHRIIGFDETSNDFHFGVKRRLLGICYDIRHAYMGDREVILEDNGMSEEKMRWHDITTPKENVYYSVNVLFPEAIFVAAAVPQIYVFSSRYYGTRALRDESKMPVLPYADYIRDKANLEVLCAGIWEALGKVVGDEELEKIIQLLQRTDEGYFDYATHYVDKCNLELLKTAVEKRKDKLRNIAKRIIKKPTAYYHIESDLKYWAKKYKTSIYELEDPNIVYPEEFDW